MGSNLAAVAADAGETGNLGKDATPELVAFSAELARRFPDVFIKRFVLPETVRQAREVFVREINSDDELMAGQMADSIAKPDQRKSREAMARLEQRESTRIAIVGLGKLASGRVVYELTNGATPLTEINKWPTKAWVCLGSYFGEVNGVNASELLTGMMVAHPVGTYAAPPRTMETPTKETETSETPALAESAK
jgi:hypothetical protein